MSPAERDQLRLQQLAERLEPTLRAAFLRFLNSLRPDQLPGLIARLESGDVAAVVDLIFGTEAVTSATAALRSTFAESMLRLVRTRSRDLSASLRLTVEAPVFSPTLIRAVRRWEDDAFRRVLEDTRNGLRETIAAELTRGIGPRQVAVALKSDVSLAGLTAYDAKIVQSFREALEEGRVKDALGRALRDKRYDKSLTGKALKPEQIEKMVAAYRRKLVAFRSETFARTAAIQAANEASSESWRAAVAQGAIPAAEVKRYWVVAQDERLCKICAPIPRMNPDGVALDGTFMTPNGPREGPTMHPGCRCTVFVRRERAGVIRAPQPGTTRLILPRAS